MPSSEKIAVAAHLHVLLRRKTGRVTDTEWMASNQEYAHEVARFAREKAAEDGHMDLVAWADKLEDIMASPDAKLRMPLVKLVADAVRQRSVPPQVPAVSALNVPDRQSAKTVDTEQEVYPEPGFTKSTSNSFFGEGDQPRKPRDKTAPQYVKGLR